MYLLGTAIGYTISPPENMSWLRAWLGTLDAQNVV